MERAVFLDRDGVLNRAVIRDDKPYPPASLDELEILTEAREACSLLRGAGFKLICVTNQPDVARGSADPDAVGAINARICVELGLDKLYTCPHDDGDDCDCRKPKPGLLIRGAREFRIALNESYMVGDRWRDIEAGEKAGCRTVFVQRHYRERQPRLADATVNSTLEAARWILANQ